MGFVARPREIIEHRRYKRQILYSGFFSVSYQQSKPNRCARACTFAGNANKGRINGKSLRADVEPTQRCQTVMQTCRIRMFGCQPIIDRYNDTADVMRKAAMLAIVHLRLPHDMPARVNVQQGRAMCAARRFVNQQTHIRIAFASRDALFITFDVGIIGRRARRAHSFQQTSANLRQQRIGEIIAGILFEERQEFRIDQSPGIALRILIDAQGKNCSVGVKRISPLPRPSTSTCKPPLRTIHSSR